MLGFQPEQFKGSQIKGFYSINLLHTASSHTKMTGPFLHGHNSSHGLKTSTCLGRLMPKPDHLQSVAWTGRYRSGRDLVLWWWLLMACGDSSCTCTCGTAVSPRSGTDAWSPPQPLTAYSAKMPTPQHHTERVHTAEWNVLSVRSDWSQSWYYMSKQLFLVQ